MQVICVVTLTEAGKSAEFTPQQLADEVGYVRTQYGAGVIRQIWTRTDIRGAVLLMEVAKPEDAAAVIAALPLGKLGLLQLESLLPLGPYPGFGPSA